MKKITCLLLSLIATPALASESPFPASHPIDNVVTAQIVAKDQTVIGAPMNGRLEAFPFRDGDSFHKGDVLAKYRCASQNAQLEKAKAEKAKAMGILSIQNQMKNMGQYSKADIISAHADLGLAKSDEDMASASISDCTVLAPYDGIVAGTNVHNYQFTQLGSPLIDIVNTSNYEISMIVKSKLLSKLGKTFNVNIKELNKTYGAHYTRTSGRFDPVSQTVRVYGEFDENHSDIRPGMTGEVDIKE